MNETGENDKSQLSIFKILMKWKYCLQKKAQEEERDFLQFEEIRGGKNSGGSKEINTPSANISIWSDVWKKKNCANQSDKRR